MSGKQNQAEHRFHPFAALAPLQKYLLLVFTPFLRAIWLLEAEAFLLALGQNFALLLLLFGYAFVSQRAAHWAVEPSPNPMLWLHQGVLLRKTAQIPLASIATATLEQPLLLRIFCGCRLRLYYKGNLGKGYETLFLFPKDAQLLMNLLF